MAAELQRQPGGRASAPGRLELVQAFVNTNDIERRRDKFRTREGMRAWLADHGLIDVRDDLSGAGFARLLEVRESLRALALANTGCDLDLEALGRLNRTARQTRLYVQFGEAGEGWLQAAEEGLDRALGVIIGIVFEAMKDGSWPRMKACRRDACHWLFFDHSKSGSSIWCSMDPCGNRMKTAAYRRRKRAKLDP
jgi:predicted RNA-binding Zn ribbon-like protein